jgi:prepilin-type N-terminal cleavage/methylation domain-containing protein
VRGFTLPELLMVMALAAVLLVLAVPALSTLRGNMATAAEAQRLLSLLRVARASAAAGRVDTVLCPRRITGFLPPVATPSPGAGCCSRMRTGMAATGPARTRSSGVEHSPSSAGAARHWTARGRNLRRRGELPARRFRAAPGHHPAVHRRAARGRIAWSSA